MIIKRIFIRMIEKELTKVSSEIKLQIAKDTMENLLNIQWISNPEIDLRGGIKMTIMVCDNIDFDVFIRELDDAGYLFVI